MTTRRAPLIPSGWPMAIAPPFTFTFSGSSPSSRMTWRLCEAKASFSSTRSRSPASTPARASTLRTAGTGPMPMTRGSTPATAPGDEAAERLDAELGGPLGAGDDQRGCPVVDAARVARRDGSVRPEGRLEGGELLRRRVRPRVLVADDVADRHELVVEAALPRRRPHGAAGSRARRRPAPRARPRSARPRSHRSRPSTRAGTSPPCAGSGSASRASCPRRSDCRAGRRARAWP